MPPLWVTAFVPSVVGARVPEHAGVPEHCGALLSLHVQPAGHFASVV